MARASGVRLYKKNGKMENSPGKHVRVWNGNGNLARDSECNKKLNQVSI